MGQHDRIPLPLTTSLNDSVRLIKVNSLVLSVIQYYSKRRVQGKFRYNGTEYHLWVTDPLYERRYLKKPDGEYDISDCYLTISLGEPYEGYVYKLIAAVIEPR